MNASAKIEWRRNSLPGEYAGWQAFVDGSHVGTVFVHGGMYVADLHDIIYENHGSHALAAEALARYVTRGAK